jgi:antitoxin HigA-1
MRAAWQAPDRPLSNRTCSRKYGVKHGLVSGKAGISAEMAIRLEKAFGGGTETWLRMQSALDLAWA